jgi:hypothetical protein
MAIEAVGVRMEYAAFELLPVMNRKVPESALTAND